MQRLGMDRWVLASAGSLYSLKFPTKNAMVASYQKIPTYLRGSEGGTHENSIRVLLLSR